MSVMAEMDLMKDDVFDYLDDLRESGVTNMFGAGPYLEKAFDLNKSEARFLLTEWMRTFSQRH
jgi:hypothetical protein